MVREREGIIINGWVSWIPIGSRTCCTHCRDIGLLFVDLAYDAIRCVSCAAILVIGDDVKCLL